MGHGRRWRMSSNPSLTLPTGPPLRVVRDGPRFPDGDRAPVSLRRQIRWHRSDKAAPPGGSGGQARLSPAATDRNWLAGLAADEPMDERADAVPGAPPQGRGGASDAAARLDRRPPVPQPELGRREGASGRGYR